ncbi:YihY/virulence factor BrkB family protein [Salinisphaera sp. Q1T1-3]|uniref:YihY/virulence factor BrkB family protein n=1 Tax=Salinisphaera sp. Q1T1-3 TaxID=2321229 RepID=UPI000E756712|nr:YihY/virulence factor BrkB family protein [Salinisphaera sp. Q1T1-3]RJS94384.1 YihY/virulence factor BrkB family protein [Salinisphaera sp. Q1T1-3]
MSALATARQTYERWIWPSNFEALPRHRRAPIRLVRMLMALVAEFRDGEITLRAMSLVYTTLVSLVPLLALAFSLLKAFGVDNALRPTLERFLAPLGSGSSDIVDKIVGFVSNVQVGVLGVVGVVALIYSVLSLIQKVEAGCNFIWRVRAPRPLARRVTDYISVLVAGPLVILAAASITASLGRNSSVAYLSQLEPFGMLLYGIGRLLPYVLYSIGFTLLFKFIPNTRVRFLPALGGGIFSGVLWQTASVGFALFAKNAGNVNAIYSSFAILILLLIWLYVSWMILLMGCRVAFWLQYPERLARGSYPPRLGAAEAERLALLTAATVASRYARGDGPTDVALLVHLLRAAPDHIHNAIARLVAAGLLVETADASDTSVVPRADLSTLRVRDVLAVVRSGDRQARLVPRADVPVQAVDSLLARADTARDNAIGETTLRDLVEAVPRHDG